MPIALESLNQYTRSTDEFVRLAQEHGHLIADVTAFVARTRNLAPDHAEGVVRRRWRTRATGFDQIYLAENEWGNSLMEEVAQAYFDRVPECNFVSVHEHAGWSLGFARQKTAAGLTCWASANDLACFAPDTPRPTHYTGEGERRRVTRPDLREVSSLADYQTVSAANLLTAFTAGMAAELAVPAEELQLA